MKERIPRGPRPRVRPQMNTDTRRHDAKTGLGRRSKYREDLLDDEDLQAEPDDGVLADFPDEPESDEADSPPGVRAPDPGRRRR